MSKTEIGSLVKSFRNFVESHKCDKERMTHTTLIKGEGGKYCFEGKDYQDFMERYVEIVKADANIDLHFVERPNNNKVTFLFIDVDYDHKGKNRIYTDEHITQIIEKTNTFIRENFNVTNYQLSSFVTEKPEPTKRTNAPNMYKDGFHIYYPNLPMEEQHRYYVIDYLSSLMIEDELLEGIAYKNDADKIFDMSIIKSNGILMIGSKKQGGHPYKLTHVYDADLNDLGIDGYDDEELIYTLSNQRYDAEASIQPYDDEEILAKIEEVNKQYDGGNKKKKTKNEKQAKSNKQDDYREARANDSKTPSKKKTVSEQRDVEMAKALTQILSKKRAHDYVSWRRTGFALRAIDDSLFDSFVEFSKKDKGKYNDGKISCEEIWHAAKGFEQFYSIGTLRHWARIDNSVEYYKIIRKMNDSVFGKAETSKHVDIAQVVYELYKDRFVCVDIQKKKWYEFQEHRWIFVQSAYTLEELISDEVRKMMTMYCTEKMRATVDDDEGFKEDNEYKKYSKLMKMIDNLGDVKFRENVVRACANKFYNASFQAKLDSNVYLVGFNNGIYDLKEMCFRDGLPTDFVSKTVGYDWAEFEPDDPVFEKINKFFSQVQIEEDMREYLLTFIAKSLRGVPDSKLHMWTGGGGNGKSATIDLIKHMLGEYYGTVPVTILTRKRGSSSSASPELADKYGIRFLVVQEPEHNDVVFVGQMKEYTGKDMIMARPLYGDPFYYNPQFTMVLTCNNLPYIPATDNGTWRRLRVTPFESEFVDEKPKGPKQFLKDEDLQEDFPNWVQPMMWLIITRYYPIYAEGIEGKKYKIHEPEKVKQFTNNYKLDSDVYAEFLDESLAKTDDESKSEVISFLFENFRQWYQASYTDKPPAKKTFVAYLKKNNYKMDKQKLYGVEYALGLS